MTDMDFVTTNNVDRFARLLERAETDERRSLLQRLLITEANRFAQDACKQSAIDRHLAEVRGAIARYRKLNDGLRENGRAMGEADRLTINLHVIHSTFVLLNHAPPRERGQ